MARGYKTYRRYRKYRRSRIVKRLLKRYKPLAGFGYNGERFKLDVQATFSVHDYGQNNNHDYQYTFMEANGNAPQGGPSRQISIPNYISLLDKYTALKSVFDQARIYGCSIQFVGAGQAVASDYINQPLIAEASQTVFAFTVTPYNIQNINYGDLIALNRKIMLSKTKPNGRLYIGRKHLGAIEGYGTGDYVQWNWDIGNANARRGLMFLAAPLGTVTTNSPGYHLMITCYMELKISSV